MNCKFACHDGNPNLTFDAKECDIKIALCMENKMGHTFHPNVMYYGSRLVWVTPMNHDGRSNEWVVNHQFSHFISDMTYFDECICQNCDPLIEYNLNVDWKDCCFKPLLKMELKTSTKSISLSCRKRKAMMQGWMANFYSMRGGQGMKSTSLISLSMVVILPPVLVATSNCSLQEQPSEPMA
jgi:hypothetical protein